MRFLIYIVMAGLIGCSEKAIDRERAQETLLLYVRQIHQATLRGKHWKMADLTHPIIIKGMGGKTRYVQHISEMTDEYKNKGFSINDIVLIESSEMVESDGVLYAVVPYEMHMNGPCGATGITSTFLIGVSDDEGLSWTFIDGGGPARDRTKFQQVFPGFPDRLEFPPGQDIQWKY